MYLLSVSIKAAVFMYLLSIPIMAEGDVSSMYISCVIIYMLLNETSIIFRIQETRSHVVFGKMRNKISGFSSK